MKIYRVGERIDRNLAPVYFSSKEIAESWVADRKLDFIITEVDLDLSNFNDNIFNGHVIFISHPISKSMQATSCANSEMSIRKTFKDSENKVCIMHDGIQIYAKIKDPVAFLRAALEIRDRLLSMNPLPPPDSVLDIKTLEPVNK